MQPANVFDFGARYFAEKKLHESDVPVKKEARGPRISVDETIHTGLEQMEEAMLGTCHLDTRPGLGANSCCIARGFLV